MRECLYRGVSHAWPGAIAIGAILSLLAGFTLPAAAATKSVLYYFGGSPDGYSPYGSLISVNGTLYGTTESGGDGGLGTVYAITPGGNEEVLHAFQGGNDGAEPSAALRKVNGILYGTTEMGGGSPNCGYGCGTVFSITPGGTETVLHAFAGGDDGEWPHSRLIFVDGKLYGTTYSGGGGRVGTVFTITQRGTEQVLHTFGGSDGWYPDSGLINVNGTLYGTTLFGGKYNQGTVYSITPTGMETVVYSFGSQFDETDGAVPYASLIAVNGVLYGTTAQGGAYGYGTVFSIAPDGTENVVHSFGSGSDGSRPFGGLISDVKGTLYGTTFYGGIWQYGTVYSVTPGGAETVLYAFGGAGDGANPYADLKNVNGTLYGTTVSGGLHNYLAGTVFTITR